MFRIVAQSRIFSFVIQLALSRRELVFELSSQPELTDLDNKTKPLIICGLELIM